MGTLDWAHWGLTSPAINHKSGVTQQISDFTVMGSGFATQYTNNPVTFTWTDGTPSTSATNTPNGVYISGQNNGFRLTAPADTSVRTLQLFVGLWNAQGKLTAHLSDSSAADYIDLSLNNPSVQVGVYTLTYNAASAGQTLVINYIQNNATIGNVTLQAATLTPGSATPDFSISASPSSLSIPSGNTANYTVTIGSMFGFSGNVGLTVGGLPPGASGSFTPASIPGSGTATLSISTTSGTAAGTYPLTITGTSGTLSHSANVTLVVTPPADFTISATPATQSVVAGTSGTYNVTIGTLNGFAADVTLSVTGLPAGSAGSFSPSIITGSGSAVLTLTTTAATSPGSYPLTISGTSGSLTHTATVTLVISAPATGGTLTSTFAIPSTTQNLASIGTVDWIHWGLTGTTADRKSGVTAQISDVTTIGGAPKRFANNPIGYTWTGGTPTATATATTTGIYIAGVNNGFRITVPAGTTQRTLKVYVGVWRAQGQFVAHLSDGSAPDVIDTSVSNSTTTALGVYTLRFGAASNGQTLTITYTQNNATNGNVTFQAATLAP
jgi:hypothetical protein